MNMQNKLYQKTILWNGDSLCAGNAQTGNWASRIAQKNAMCVYNYAVGGGTIAEGLPPMRSGLPRHSVSATLERMFEEHPTPDYIILDGGSNDADLLGRAVRGNTTPRLGTVDPMRYDGDFDRTTFCGALESVFYRSLQYWNGTKIGFVIPPKMAACGAETYENRRFYFARAVEICRKWSIPCLDLWNTCYLNPFLPWMHDPSKTPEENQAENTCMYIDGQHLTARGYDITADLVETWLQSL